MFQTRPYTVQIFYHTRAFRYLIRKLRSEIHRRLRDVPEAFRSAELAGAFTALGDTGGEPAWQTLRAYLDKVEERLAALVGRHSPSYWLHLHRRLAPRLSEVHDGKRDDNTVALVRRIAELAYAKHGDLARTDDLGLMVKVRLRTFLGGAWYEAASDDLGSKLKAKREFESLRRTRKSVVMLDFQERDFCEVFEIEGWSYEYWRISALMRSIGKGTGARWNPEINWVDYIDHDVPPLAYEIYDRRIGEGTGFHTRLGTWLDRPGDSDRFDPSKPIDAYFAVLNPNPEPEEMPVWNSQEMKAGVGYQAVNFHMGKFSLRAFREQNSFMAEAFKAKHGIELDAVMFAVWVASFFGIHTGATSLLRTKEQSLDRTLQNWDNVLYRGYTMGALNLDLLCREAIWWAKALQHEHVFSEAEVRAALEFIALSPSSQGNIALWSGGKRPIFIPSLTGILIDLAAIAPFLTSLFFGLRKTQQAGGHAFEDTVRNALSSRGLDVCFQGKLKWKDEDPRELDVGVRIGDRLILVECFSYELPVDYEIGKPSIFETRKRFISGKLDQAKSLAKRLTRHPAGTNFDFSWAASIEWRVVSPFVEFAWNLNEPLFDEAGIPRLLQVRELIDYLADGKPPAATEALKPLFQRAIQGIS